MVYASDSVLSNFFTHTLKVKTSEKRISFKPISYNEYNEIGVQTWNFR